ncbi:MAG: hypothetical protein PHT94_05015 [Candidatus Nanoarchaeia archaeon]|nr:hypothetical protein [Candidatus Nanoarchaeia archaeon]
MIKNIFKTNIDKNAKKLSFVEINLEKQIYIFLLKDVLKFTKNKTFIEFPINTIDESMFIQNKRYEVKIY